MRANVHQQRNLLHVIGLWSVEEAGDHNNCIFSFSVQIFAVSHMNEEETKHETNCLFMKTLFVSSIWDMPGDHWSVWVCMKHNPLLRQYSDTHWDETVWNCLNSASWSPRTQWCSSRGWSRHIAEGLYPGHQHLSWRHTDTEEDDTGLWHGKNWKTWNNKSLYEACYLLFATNNNKREEREEQGVQKTWDWDNLFRMWHTQTFMEFWGETDNCLLHCVQDDCCTGLACCFTDNPSMIFISSILTSNYPNCWAPLSQVSGWSQVSSKVWR